MKTILPFLLVLAVTSCIKNTASKPCASSTPPIIPTCFSIRVTDETGNDLLDPKNPYRILKDEISLTNSKGDLVDFLVVNSNGPGSPFHIYSLPASYNAIDNSFDSKLFILKIRNFTDTVVYQIKTRSSNSCYGFEYDLVEMRFKNQIAEMTPPCGLLLSLSQSNLKKK